MPTFQYQINHETVTVNVEKAEAGYSVKVNGETFAVTATPRGEGELMLLINGQPHLSQIANDGPRRWVSLAGITTTLTVPQASKKTRRGKSGGHAALEAHMPGLVRAVLVNVGEAVTQGQTLVTLEAMKMEIRVNAPRAGVVEKIGARVGETVTRGQLLVELMEG